ncbi:MAG: AMP-binding protein, partial [Halieaceae bacterium]|nr:AMP-binding protein [Halieaceae bacterium]
CEILAEVERSARRDGARVALCGDGPAELSYAGLEEAVARLADDISRSGCRRIALQASNGIPWAVADLAAMAAGVALVPIPAFFSREQVDHLLEQAAVERVLTDAPSHGYWTRRPGWYEEGHEPALAGLTSLRRHGPRMAHRLDRFSGKITFTSGSSGQPRGVQLDNATLARTSAGIVRALRPLEPRQHLAVLPLATMLENIAGLYAPLMNGSQTCLPSDERIGLGSASLDVERFCALLESSEADTLILVPQLLTAVVSLVEVGLLRMPSFRMIAVGGGRVARSLHDRARALDLPVCEGYGLSECGSVLSLNLPGCERRGSVGRPLDHARLRISSRGEIEVREPQMAGYLDDSEAPGSSAEWYATGDLGHLDGDGFLYIDGRRRNVFITAYGRNVNPEWPEAALTQHAAIAHALVHGEAREHNLALLWMRFELSAAEVSDIVEQANAELPDYARIHRWQIMESPLAPALHTANGRLRRERVLETFAGLIEDHYEKHSLYAA